MRERLLACVNSAPAALAAARLAIHMATRHDSEIKALMVVEDDGRTMPLGGVRTTSEDDPERESRAILERVATIARERGATIETVSKRGDALRVVMAEAEEWKPDLILIGRTGRRGPGSPMLGSLTAHVLEFSRWPVVVVPAEYRPTTDSDPS